MHRINKYFWKFSEFKGRREGEKFRVDTKSEKISAFFSNFLHVRGRFSYPKKNEFREPSEEDKKSTSS